MSFTVQAETGFFSTHPIERALADLRLIVDQHLPAGLLGQRGSWLQLVDDVRGALNEMDRVVNRDRTLARIAELGRQIEELQKGLDP